MIKKILNSLKDKPFFRQVFYYIYNLMKDDLYPERFLALETNGYMLGVYRKNSYKLWLRMIRGDFEIREINLVKSIDFNYFIDIGAHIGYYSVAIGTHKKCPVLAFEPNFKNYQSLIKNLEINKIDYVAKNVGLSNESGSAILFGDDGAGSLNKATFATIPDKTSTITLKKLDEFISLIPKNAKVFIKIDVEGNEYNLLQGSIEFIKQVKPVAMLMEISPVWSNGKNPHHESTLTLLKSLNYKVNEISSGSYIFKCMGDTNSVS